MFSMKKSEKFLGFVFIMLIVVLKIGCKEELEPDCSERDVTCDEMEPDFPGQNATCDEIALFLINYADAHGSCTESKECIPTAIPNGYPCEFCWASFTKDMTFTIPGINSSYGNAQIQNIIKRLSNCCGNWGGGGSEIWTCSCVADAISISAVPECNMGKCITKITTEGSCLPEPPQESFHQEITEDILEVTESMEGTVPDAWTGD